MKRPILFLVLTLFIFGCSQSSDRSVEHRFTSVIEDGISRSTTTGGPKYQGELFAYSKILEIQEDPDAPGSLMDDMVAPHYGPDGRYYFLDINGHRLVIFNSDGSFSMVIGQQGDGPGDLRSPTELTFVGGMLNVIQTTSAPRITRFNWDGSLSEVITIQRPPRTGWAPRFFITKSGDILTNFFQVERGEQYEMMRAGVVVTSTESDTIASISTSPVILNEMVMLDRGRGLRRTPVPLNFAGFPWMVYSEIHGIILSTGDIPELKCYYPNCELQMRIYLDLPPEPVTSEDRQELEDEFNEMINRIAAEDGENHASIQRYRDRRDVAKFVDQKALWRTFQVDEQGWFWLLLPTYQTVNYEKPRILQFRVLNSGGEYIGDTTIPSSQTWGMSHDRLITEVQDPETGERSWDVFLITSAIEGFEYPN